MKKSFNIKCRYFRSWLAISVLFLLLPGLAGCAWSPTQTAAAGDPPAAIVAALSANRQDQSVQPRLIWLPRMNEFSPWWTGVVSDGWIGTGQHYAGSQGMAARVDYYSQDGRLKWTYKSANSTINSANYLCAARRADGTLIVGGRYSDGSNPDVGSVTAFSTTGQILWSSLIDVPENENLGVTVAQCLITADDRILVVLDSTLFNVGKGSQPSIIVCLDKAGQQLWRCQLDFEGMTYNHYAVLDPDGGLYLALYGYSRTGNQMSTEYNWLVRINRDGQELWRRPLSDSTYQYQVRSLARDSQGNLYLSCAARYVGATPTPTMPAETKEFHDRYRSMAWNPAALLKLDNDGNIQWKKLLNGEFGASGGQVFCDGLAVYWRATLTDDIVPPYIFMSIDHRAVSHEILAVLNPDSKDFKYHQFSKEESAAQLVQRVENGQPVLIGIEPFIPPQEWATETIIPGKG